MSSLIRYQAAAAMLKVAGATPTTQWLYRWMGNRVGERRRQQIGPHFKEYLKRGAWFIDQVRQLDLPRHVPLRALELGTGWLHFYAVFLRLFHEAQVTLFDVWDCRQLEALRWVFSQVPDYLASAMPLEPEQLDEIRVLSTQLVAQPSFEDMYQLLGFTYVVEPQGALDGFWEGQFDLVFSFDVLEHVRAENLADSIASYCRVLRPGGYSIHQIGLDDHLALYDRHASRRQFLSYSDPVWKLRFENKLQYFNRVPYSTFRDLFRACGMEEVHASAQCEPGAVQPLRVAPPFSRWSQEDLEATRACFIYRKARG